MRRRSRTRRALPSPLVLLLALPCVGCAPADDDAAGPPGSPEADAGEQQGELGRTILRANEALLDRGETGAVGDFFAPDFLLHAGGETIPAGPAFIEAFVTDLRTAFPDLEIEVEILAEADDRVAWRRTHRGTHQGPFMGVAPTDRPLEWEALLVTRFEDGRIAEEWSVTDLGGKLGAGAGGPGEGDGSGQGGGG